MLFGKKTKIYAPNISANVEADVDAKMKNGGEKLLTKMTYGGASMDMSDQLVNKMRLGGSTANTYSGPKKKK